MDFKTQFKSGRGVDISEVWWEGVQEATATEGSGSNGRQMGGRQREVNRGRRCERVGGRSDVKEFGDTRRFVDGFKSERQNVKIDAVAGPGASGVVEEQG